MLSPLEETFQHVPGIGPKTEAKIRNHGYAHWGGVLERPNDLPLGPRLRSALLAALAGSRRALAQGDIPYFLERLPAREQWRILATYRDDLTYFDIETNGLSYDAEVTCVACLHHGHLHTYLRDENLDDFLDLLEDVTLLVSFNGASFDVPQLLHAWHIPELPCPHLDLRWACYHRGLQGGLKELEGELGLRRPADLQGIDGLEAVWLWYEWQRDRNPEARRRLLRYCAADVLTLPCLATHLLKAYAGMATEVSAPAWRLLDAL